jgi:hypothetical protein
MVLQLCGRVCRRLSFKNPHHSFDEDFLLYKSFSFAAPIMSKAIILQFLIL